MGVLVLQTVFSIQLRPCLSLLTKCNNIVQSTAQQIGLRRELTVFKTKYTIVAHCCLQKCSGDCISCSYVAKQDLSGQFWLHWLEYLEDFFSTYINICEEGCQSQLSHCKKHQQLSLHVLPRFSPGLLKPDLSTDLIFQVHISVGFSCDNIAGDESSNGLPWLHIIH